MANTHLANARKEQDSEFYTQLKDIENEMKHHKKHFEDRIVFCNCDDPQLSQFWNYFKMYFDDLGLKKIISTHYRDSFVFEDEEAYMLEWDGKSMKREPLRQRGCFKSDECKELMYQSDIVVTNPPFSLFPEFVDQVMDFNKDFLIIGNFASVSIKNIFQYVQNNEMWLGCTPRGHDFIRPDGTKKSVNSAWFTNLKHNKQNEFLELHETYSPSKYPEYDNYHAIEVCPVKTIPEDYDGIMAVPITFLDKYNPKQFEIMDANDIRKHDDVPIKSHGLIKDKDGTVEGHERPKFPRFVIRHRRD